VKRVYREGNALYADLGDLKPETAQSLVDGTWPNRSAEIYSDLEGRGPYLKNLTLLGVHPPAVKGLKRIQPSQIVPEAQLSAPAFAMSEGETGDQKVYRFTYTSLKEGTMPENDGTVVQLAEEKAKAEIALREAQAESTKLKEQNASLLAEKDTRDKAFKLSEACTTADKKLAKLREARKVTPGMEDAGLTKLFALAEYHPEPLRLGDETINLAELLAAVMEAIPATVPDKGAVKLGEKVVTETNPELTATEIAFAEKYANSPAERDKMIASMKERKALKGGK
jgi:hypothetical protein